jgi:hypothetical protein
VRADDLTTFLAILFDEHHVSPRRCAEMAGIVVRISRPNEAVIGHVIPFFASDFAGFATNAHSRISKEPNLNIGVNVRMPALVRTVCAFADHGNAGAVE